MIAGCTFLGVICCTSTILAFAGGTNAVGPAVSEYDVSSAPARVRSFRLPSRSGLGRAG